MNSDGLTFAQLRTANVTRCESAFHPLEDWSKMDWGCALFGELGELSNLVKKRRRGELVPLRAVADELADAAIYLDLLTARVGVDLGDAVEQYLAFATAAPIPGTFAALRRWNVGWCELFGVTYEERGDCAWCVRVGKMLGKLMAVLECWDAEQYDVGDAAVELLITIDRLAYVMGIDLGASVTRKFNEVSKRVGSDVRLGDTVSGKDTIDGPERPDRGVARSVAPGS